MKSDIKALYPQWGIKDVVLLFILSYLLSLVFPFVLGLLNFEITVHAVIVWSNIFFILVEFIIVYFYLTRALKLNYVDSIKLRIPTNFNLFWCLLLALGGLFFVKSLGILFPDYAASGGGVDSQIKKEFSGIYIIMMLFAAPFFEEVFWRGFAYPAFRKRFSGSVAIVSISLLFTAAHLRETDISIVAIVGVLTLSIVFCILRETTKSTLPCILTHFFYNLGLVGISFVKVLYRIYLGK